VGLVAKLAYHPDGWRVDRLSRGQATLTLIDAAVAGPSRTAEVYAVAALAAGDALAIAGARGDAGVAARRLLDRMDAAFSTSGHAPGQAPGQAPGHEARAAPHSSSRIEWTTESRHAPRTKT
jgi:hypothetical protein